MKVTFTRFGWLLILFFAYKQSYSQLGPAIKWQKCLGGSRDDKAYDIALTPDGGFIVAGSSKSIDGNITGHHGGIDTADAWLVKLDQYGNIQWQKSFGGSKDDYFTSVIRTSDNAYLCVGVTSSNDGDVTGNHGGSDYWVVKVSSTGSILWSKCFGGTLNETSTQGIQTSDGGYALVGSAVSQDGNVTGYISGAQNVLWVVKIDSVGNLVWQKCYGNSNAYHYPGGILEDDDHNLLVTVNPNGSNTGNFPVFNSSNDYLAKVNKDNGNIISTKLGAGPYAENGALVKKPNGYFSSVQADISYPACTYLNARVKRFDATGSILDEIISPQTSCAGSPGYTSVYAVAHGLAAISDSSFIGAGSLTDDGTGPTGVHNQAGGHPDACIGVGRFIPSGNKLLTKNYGGSGDDGFNSVKVLSTGNDYIAAGYTNSNDFDVSGNHGNYDFWVVRLAGVNRIIGNVFIDFNGNGIKDGNDTAFNKIIVQSVKPGLTQYSVPYNGFFENDVDTGVYTSSVILAKPYYTVSPSLKTSTFTTYKNADTVNFALTPIAGKRDYSVAFYTLSSPRPGGFSVYYINYANNGTDTITNKQLVFIKDKHTQLFSLPTGATASGDTLRWTLTGVLPGGSGQIPIGLKFDSIPNLNLLDTVTLRVYLDSTSDVLPADNSDVLRQIVRGSYDPNDKQENAGGFISPQDISGGKRLTYTIRFQNTGNDTAYNIIVRDTLDTRLDPTTIEMVGASGPYQFNVVNGKYATWIFNNINLVDSLHNEPLSHGYITYRVKPLSSVALGDTIHNGASIYFDFNPAVKTATQITVVKVSAPPQPTVTGLQSNYCSNAGIQKGIIMNLPAAGSGIASSVSLNSAALTVAADSSFSFNTATAGPGNDTITVIYSNTSGTATYKYYFTITASVTPDVNISSNISTVVNLTDNVILTASNASGGGSAPLYTFAKDKAITNILQAEGTPGTLSIAPSTLAVGSNWFYVRMRTSSSCYTVQTNVDSVQVNRSSITGIVDVDNPGQVITVYPNPFVQTININGLSAAKTYIITISDASGQVVYRQQVSNSSHFAINQNAWLTGNYWLRLYDVKKNRLIGTSLLLKE